jgi:hypothetical protein
VFVSADPVVYSAGPYFSPPTPWITSTPDMPAMPSIHYSGWMSDIDDSWVSRSAVFQPHHHQPPPHYSVSSFDHQPTKCLDIGVMDSFNRGVFGFAKTTSTNTSAPPAPGHTSDQLEDQDCGLDLGRNGLVGYQPKLGGGSGMEGYGDSRGSVHPGFDSYPCYLPADLGAAAFFHSGSMLTAVTARIRPHSNSSSGQYSMHV